jgi:hypothetical protein
VQPWAEEYGYPLRRVCGGTRKDVWEGSLSFHKTQTIRTTPVKASVISSAAAGRLRPLRLADMGYMDTLYDMDTITGKGEASVPQDV